MRVFPLNTVLFPGARLDLHIFEPRYRQMIAECVDADEPFGVCLIREGSEAGDPDVAPHAVGTTASIVELTELDHGRYFITTSGRVRFRIDAVVSREPYLLCDVTLIEDEANEASDLETLTTEIRDVFRDYLRLLVEFTGMKAEVDLPADPVEASFLIGDALQVADSMKQRLLELSSTRLRLREELDFLRRLLPQLRSLLDRRRGGEPKPPRSAPAGGSSRAAQEKFFGKHFSAN